MAQVAIIVPVYNVAQYLTRCVDSLLNQSHKDIEILLIDDGSTDSSGRICDNYHNTETRVHLIRQANQGLSAARNAGLDWLLANSKAEFVSFVDADDWVEPNYISTLLEGIKLSNDISCLTPRRCYDSGRIEYPISKRKWHILSPEEYISSPISHNIIACGKLYRTSMLSSIRFPIGKLHEDVYTTYKILFAASRIAFRRLPLYNYFSREGSITQSEWSPRRLDLIDALKEQCEFFQKHGFRTAYMFARGRLLTAMIEMIPNLSRHFPEKANEFMARIESEQGVAPLSFWPNRDFYRHYGTNHYKLKWMLGVILDFFKNPTHSWIANEFLPIAKSECSKFFERHRR